RLLPLSRSRLNPIR
ncbi:hypothetical protein ECEC1864_2465, partial [Escherichia coli EC1864]